MPLRQKNTGRKSLGHDLIFHACESRGLAWTRPSGGPFRKKIASFDTGRYYEVARLGPIFLAWNMVVAKNDKGKVTKQKYKIKKEKNHLIWVKWKRPFPGTKTYWSAEPQGNFPDNMKEKVRNKLDKKEIWPYPSRLCGDDKWMERAEECQRLGFKPWQKHPREPWKSQRWVLEPTNVPLLEWINCGSDTADTSTDNSKDNSTEEDDQV